MRMSGCVQMPTSHGSGNPTIIQEEPQSEHKCCNPTKQESECMEEEIQANIELCSHLECCGERSPNGICVKKVCNLQDHCAATGKTFTWKGSIIQNKPMSSFVCIFTENGFDIGNIQHFLIFDYHEVHYVFVTLSVFSTFQSQCGLHFINTSQSEKKTMKFDRISKPLVVGHDDNDDSIIWLLNVDKIVRLRSNGL